VNRPPEFVGEWPPKCPRAVPDEDHDRLDLVDGVLYGPGSAIHLVCVDRFLVPALRIDHRFEVIRPAETPVV
jgi:hypothetical protein